MDTRDSGFALPIVVFALVLLGMIGGAALQASRDELLSAEAVSHSNQAFYAADAGIHSAKTTVGILLKAESREDLSAYVRSGNLADTLRLRVSVRNN